MMYSKNNQEFLTTQIAKALEEWKAAENFLNYASEPELVEFAIYDLEAARRKYAFMLNKLREVRGYSSQPQQIQ